MKIYLGKGFLFALSIFAVAELVTNVFFQDKASGLTGFGYEPESGIVDHEDGRVEFLRSWGRRFYQQTISDTPREGVARIFTMGDSVPRGKTVERSYAGMLVAGLAEKGIDAESLNLAVPGYGSRRIQMIVERTLRYQPDLVILHLNSSNEYEDERDLARYESLQSWHPRNWISKSKVFQKLRQQKTEKLVWRYLPTGALMLNGGIDFDTEQASGSDPLKRLEWEKRTIETTRKSVEMLREAGVAVILVTQCSQTDGILEKKVFLEDLARSLKSEHVSHLSMYDIFEKIGPAPHFADSSHLRPTGHELLAKALAPMIEELLR